MRRLIICGWLAAALTFAALPCWAVTLDNTSHGTFTSGNSISWSHTTNTCTNCALDVTLYAEGSLSAATCTYNGVSMTLLKAQADGAGATNTAMLIVAGQAAGSHTISCSVSNSGGVFQGQARSWNGVNQATPNRSVCATCARNDGGSGSTSASATVSNALSGDMVIDTIVAYINSSETLSAGGSQTQDFSQTGFGGGTGGGGASHESASGSTSMTWSWSPGATKFWAQIAVALVPASGGAAAPPPTQMMMGCCSGRAGKARVQVLEDRAGKARVQVLEDPAGDMSRFQL